MKNLRYNIVLQPEPEGGFTVIVPSLPGCVTYGKDLAEARLMAEDAIECYVGSMRDDGEEPESDVDRIFADSVEISVTA